MDHEESPESALGNESASAVSVPTDKNVLESRVFKGGAIYLFLRSDYKKPTWFCRVKVPNSKGYVWRSTRTTNEHAAYAFADNLYNQSLVRVLSGNSANAKRLGPVLEGYLKHLKPRHDQASVRNKSLLITRLTPFLRGKSFEDVNTALLSEIITELVARLIGLETACRSPWDDCDLVTRSGLRIEVKAAAYRQAWHDDTSPPSKIVFSGLHGRVLDGAVYAAESTYNAHLYVFCLLDNREIVQPLELQNWRFWLLAGDDLARPTRNSSQRRSISLASVIREGQECTGAQLAGAVRAAEAIRTGVNAE